MLFYVVIKSLPHILLSKRIKIYCKTINNVLHSKGSEISEVPFMKRETVFLKFVIVLMSLPVLAACIFLLPKIAEFFAELNPEFAYLQYPFLIGLYITAIVFFCALYHSLKLLSYIDKNEAFSELSVKALKNIKYCAITIGALYVVFMPLLYLMAEMDDAPGIIVIGMVIIFGCMAVGVFAAVLQKLLKNAIDIKSENDLTV